MTWPIAGLGLIVAAILTAGRQPALRGIFRWLPTPLWCYALPAIAVSLGWLPERHAAYRMFTDHLLPVALGALLLGVDLPAVARTGRRAVIAAVIGAAGIISGSVVAMWMWREALPPEAWKGVGTLAATWTGGTMNLLALRLLVGTPEAIFAPLVLVDAVIAYGWMALLVAASAFEGPLNRWLRVERNEVTGQTSPLRRDATSSRGLIACALLSLGLSFGARAISASLPISPLISSAAGWTVVLVTTAALGLSLLPPIRRVGAAGEPLSYPLLYLVLAATGAQARLDALWSAPVWLAAGLAIVTVHGAMMLCAGRLLRLPLGILATASQANIGGVVSAPLVGAVYHQSLAPVGLVLAMAGNALGTYLGLCAATLCRWLMQS